MKSADVDIHSSYGGVVESAPWYLLQALQSLRAADGRILVEGLYEEVQKPNERELALVDTYAQRNPGEISQIYGFGIASLTRGPRGLSKTFLFLNQLLISKGFSQVIKDKGLKRFCQQKPVLS